MRTAITRTTLLLTMCAVLPATLPAFASPEPAPVPDGLRERLLATGEEIGTLHARNRDGTMSWALVVDEGFDPAAVTSRGGAVDWAYPNQGVALARSADVAFGAGLVAAGLARSATPTLIADRQDEERVLEAGLDGAPWSERSYANGPDLYAENGLWPFYAIGAARPVPSDATVSGWTPEWQLKHDGDGVTIGNNDVGGPVLWCDPLDVRVDLGLPLSGVCALWGTSPNGDDCVFEEVGPVPAAALCKDLGVLLEVPPAFDGKTCSIADASLSGWYELFFGYDYLNLDELAPFFRPRRLHPDFEWYRSPAEAAADPTLGEPGGVLPLFHSVDDYRAYAEDRYLGALMPTGIEVVNEQFAFAEMEIALTEAFVAALDDGTAGACGTADPRLPDPDTLVWTPYAYQLFEPPFHRQGVPPAEGLNGYDRAGELRVIIDPDLVAIDMFGNVYDGHGTFTASPMSARHRPDASFGSIRGLAPGARLISYPGTHAFSTVNAFRRAGDDGVVALNNSWTGWDVFSKWARGNVALEEALTLAILAAVDDASKQSLLVFSAGNQGTDLNALRADLGVASVVPDLPGSLVVGGTAGRDYRWSGDIPAWMPDAPGRPYDDTRQAFNLDRPMINSFGGETVGGTNYGSRVDLVAPSGTVYAPTCPKTDPTCSLVCGDCFLVSATLLEGEPGDPAGYYNVGAHAGLVGTSFSAPLVTGAAALVAQAYEAEHGRLPSPNVLARILTRSADDRVGPVSDVTARLDVEASQAAGWEIFTLETDAIEKRGPDPWMGNGRLNVPKAIEEAQR